MDITNIIQARVYATYHWWRTQGTQAGLIAAERLVPLKEATRIVSEITYSPLRPLTLIADIITDAIKHNVTITQIDIINNKIIIRCLGVGSKGQRFVVVDDAAVIDSISKTLCEYSNAMSPQSADSPLSVISGMPLSHGVAVPLRMTVASGLMVEKQQVIGQYKDKRERTGNKGIYIRVNYIVNPDLTLRGLPPDIREGLVDAIINRERILVVGPSGSGKTTVIQSLLILVSKKYPLLSTVIVGRYLEPLAFSRYIETVGIPDNASAAVLPGALQLTQRTFGSHSASLEVAVGHGPTRTDPDTIIVDEILVPGDATLAMEAISLGAGFISTIHASTNNARDMYQRRLQLLTPYAYDFADWVVATDKRQIVAISCKNVAYNWSRN